MTKKIFAISTLLLVLVVGAIFVYNFAFKKPASNKAADSSPKITEEGKNNTPATNQPKSDSDNAGSAISEIAGEPVFGATLSADGKSIYYFLAGNGQINQVDLNGKLEKVLSTAEFTGLKEVLWNKPKSKIIVKTEESPNLTRFYYYDLSNKTLTPLKENLDSATWSNLGDKIIYKYFDSKTKKRSLSVSDPDGKNWHDLATFDYRYVNISPIFGTSLISFWPSPDAYTATSTNVISFSGEDKKEILRDRFGANLLWAPSGTLAAVSYTDQKGGHKTDLALMNSQGGEFRSLAFPTFTGKCVFTSDSKFLYCALPGDISGSSILPNDWQENKIKTADTFWKIEIASGKKERLVDPEKISGSIDVIRSFLSQDEKTLFFTNKSDGKLYKVKL